MQSIVLFILWQTWYFHAIHSQAPDWNGDPNICSPDITQSSCNLSLPEFPKRALFTVETISAIRGSESTIQTTATFTKFYYDYDANIMVKEQNDQGFVFLEFYYYSLLQKMTYYPQKHCVVTDIPLNIDYDGQSAVQFPNGTYHIRPLDEFLNFITTDNLTKIVPTCIGFGQFRDIDATQWKVCLVNKNIKRTESRVWSFVKPDFQTSLGPISNTSIPLGYMMNASVMLTDTSPNQISDELMNIVAFKPQSTKPYDFITIPRGIFCPDMLPGLVNLSDSGIQWPSKYTVKILATTSRGVRTNPLRLHVDNDPEKRMARYDYMIDDENNYQTIIVDYREQVTYVIGQTLGICQIQNGVPKTDVNPGSNPIEFFVKLKETMLDQPPKNAWQYRGIRACRGSSIYCETYTMSWRKYPPIVDSQTGIPTGQNWDETHIEYAWSSSDLTITPESNKSRILNYPVSLFLRTHQTTSTSTGNEYYSEDIDYEFYEMSTNLADNAFDVSVCYRSRNWPYLHLAFTVNVSNGILVDGNHLDRKLLYDRILDALQQAMNPISRIRIQQLEIDHDIATTPNTLSIIFLLLGPTPAGGAVPSNLSFSTLNSDDQLSADAAREKLRVVINSGNFYINMELLDGDRSNITFKAVANSLLNAKEFMASHPLMVNLKNITVSQTVEFNKTITDVQTVIVIDEKIDQKWSSGAQAGGIVGGLVIGTISGCMIVFLTLGIIQIIRRRSAASSASGGIQMESISNVLYNHRK